MFNFLHIYSYSARIWPSDWKWTTERTTKLVQLRNVWDSQSLEQLQWTCNASLKKSFRGERSNEGSCSAWLWSFPLLGSITTNTTSIYKERFERVVCFGIHILFLCAFTDQRCVWCIFSMYFMILQVYVYEHVGACYTNTVTRNTHTQTRCIWCVVSHQGLFRPL